MRRSFLPSVCLAAAVLTCLAAAAPAAELDKYLPDDAQMVAVVNVKQVTSWTPFQKQFQDQIQQVLKIGPVPDILKDTGFDPLRDVERVVVVAAASSVKFVVVPTANAALAPQSPQSVTSTTTGSPIGFAVFLLIQGQFDAAKLQAKAQQAAKDHPEQVKSSKVGDIDLWQIAPFGRVTDPVTRSIYVALLDKNTLMVTLLETQALEALDKAAGKKKTDLKDKQVRDALARADSKAALRVVASGDLIMQVRYESDAKGGVTTTTHSLHDDGIEGIRATVTLGDADLHSEWTLTVKDADKAKDMAKSMNDGLGMAVKNAATAAQQMKELQPVVDALKTIKITASGDTISVEGSAPPDAVVEGVKAFFTLRQPDVAPPPPPTVRPSDQPKPDAPPPPKKDQ